MIKWLTSICLLAAAFAGAYYFGKNWCADEKSAASVFTPTEYPVVNRSFSIVVIGHNNGAFVERTLQSVFSQNYLDYRVFYIDDASNDGSYELSRDLIYESGQMMRVTLVRNEEKLGMAVNLARVAEMVSDSEILVVVGGEDWLAHEWVLTRLNQYYANPDLWLTYGQYREYPDYNLSALKPFFEEKIRQQPYCATHLKTFYAGLFKRVGAEELRFPNEFSFMVPMLEMAKGHTAFVPEILYIANRTVREDREAVSRLEKEIRGMKPYSPLVKLEML